MVARVGNYSTVAGDSCRPGLACDSRHCTQLPPDRRSTRKNEVFAYVPVWAHRPGLGQRASGGSRQRLELGLSLYEHPP